MEHPKIEDIARLIEGKVNKQERRTLLEHFDQCDACLSIYSETATFMEEEKKQEQLQAFPNLVEHLRLLAQNISSILTPRVLVPLAALLIIITLFPIVYLTSLKNIEKAQIAHINQRETSPQYSLSPNKSKIYSAIRAGIFLTDLNFLKGIDGSEELKAKISERLRSQLGSNAPIEPPLDLEQARKHMQSSQLAELFRFGVFLERSILNTFANRIPKQVDIETFLDIARNHNLPRGVLKNLEKLKTAENAEESRTTCIAIREVILD